MFDSKDKDNVCYCETCGHKRAEECIELQCSCCLKADKIRFEHTIVSEDDLSYGEKERRVSEERDGKVWELKGQMNT